ncbi:hypothetical protein QTP88_010673 [Uroleucon formosanum]
MQAKFQDKDFISVYHGARNRLTEKIQMQIITPDPKIRILPLRYHKGRVVEVTQSVSEEGYALHPLQQNLINAKYPQYINMIDKYCRPFGTTDPTFSDFNRPQTDTTPFTQHGQDKILQLVIYHLGATPFRLWVSCGPTCHLCVEDR